MATRADDLSRDELDPFADDNETYPDPTQPSPSPPSEVDAEIVAKSPRVLTSADDTKATAGLVLAGAGKGMKFLAKHGKNNAMRLAAGGKRKEVLVRHEKGRRAPKKSLRDVLRSLRRIVFSWLPVLVPVIAPRFLAPEQTTPEFYTSHMGFALILLVPLILRLSYTFRNYMRTHPPKTSGGRPKVPPLPPLPPTRQWARDCWDIVANLDHLPIRLMYLCLFGAAVAMAGKFYPLSIHTFQSVPENPDAVRDILLALVGPVAAYLVPWMRCSHIIKERGAEIEECYVIAKTSLGYPKTQPRTATARTMRVCTPWLAVDVKKWSALYEMDEFFVLSPEDLSVDDVSKWDDFDINLNAKMPRPEEWRVRRDPRGRGATVGPANYPTAVLWDGEYDPDPLTFYLGVNLETGERQQLTLNDTSPHLAVSGGTSSGKGISLSAILISPSGPIRVADIKIGDAIFDEAGRVVWVTAMSETYQPFRTYRITFHDGTSLIVDDRHLWTTWDRSARRALSRQRTQGSLRARAPWLSDEQRSILAAEIEMSSEGDDISLPEVARLLGINKDTAPLVEVAQMIGVCRESTVAREFVYADQIVNQEQTCMVFDRSEVQTLVNAFAQSPRATVREAAKTVKVLEKNGADVVTVPDLARLTGIDHSRMRGLVKRAGLGTLRSERLPVQVAVSGKTVRRTHSKTYFYPKRPLLAALIERGLMDKDGQRDKMALPAVRTTQEIMETLRYRAAGANEDAQSWANHSIPRCAPVQFPERDLPLDPYALGAWLSGGGSVDPEVWSEFEKAGYKVRHQADKRIPDAYAHASIVQRLALLQGLMDTDGSVNRTSGTCEFYQSNEALARQVRSLVASLGMIAHLRSRPGGYRKPASGEWVECKETWTVTFTPTMQVFRLSRKADLIDPEANRSKVEMRYIVAVEEVEPVPMRCIMVNSDSHQFLVTDQYVPTHNTSLAEIIAAQVLVKPMPWDPTLHGMVALVDPKGPLARRWAGRPGVVVANGQMDAAEPSDDGTPVTGPLVMASCMEWLEEEHQRRASVLARYPDVATWVHLPDEVKKKERFFPIFVILDEYIDHTDIEKANGDERIERENAARNVTTRLASWHVRKYRNVGMHSCLIAQRVNMSLIGNVLMGNLPVRAITGQMDRSQMETMFGTTDVPQLPTARVVYENGERKVKTIPGRARIMNALGQQINKVQVMWFGGKSNSDTLDKWLPRGDAPPNGDFSLPAGKPRTPADFDAEGNFIGVVSAPPSDLLEDLPMDGIEKGAADFDPTTLPESVDDEDGVGGFSTPCDTDAIFPTAEVEAQRCKDDGCVNDAASTCSACGSLHCEYHLKSAPDPTHKALLCRTCYEADPLVSSGIAEVYGLMHSLSVKAGLISSYEVMDYDAGVIATVSTPRRQKVVQVTAVDGEITARSKSGAVSADEVPDRVRQVISSYIERKEAEQATKGGAE